MALGWSPGQITGLYREDHVNNSGSPAFSKLSDVWREAQPAIVPAAPGKGDSWLSRVRHFFLGGN